MYNLEDIEFSFSGYELELTPSLSLKIQLIDNDFEMPDHYGKFTAYPDQDTIKVDPDVLPREYRDKGKLWWTSENPLSEQRTGYRDLGYSKHESYTLARSHVVDDLDNYMRHYNGSATIVGLAVEVLWCGKSIGQDSLFGLEQLRKNHEDDRQYLLETLPDIIYAAFENAKSWIDTGIGTLDMRRILDQWQEAFSGDLYDKHKAKIAEFKAWRKGKISYQFVRLQTRAQLYKSGAVTKDYNIVDWRGGSQSHKWPADLAEALGYIK